MYNFMVITGMIKLHELFFLVSNRFHFLLFVSNLLIRMLFKCADSLQLEIVQLYAGLLLNK